MERRRGKGSGKRVKMEGRNSGGYALSMRGIATSAVSPMR